MGLRFAGQEGEPVAEAPSFSNDFAGRPLGVLLPFGAIGPRPWIRRWIVGLPRRRGTFPERDRRALALLCRVPGSERFFGARLPVHAWRGSEFDRAAFSVLFGRSRFKPAKVATKRAGRTGSQRGLMAPAWVDPVENASDFLLFSKPFCARLGPWHVNRRLLDACRRVGKK